MGFEHGLRKYTGVVQCGERQMPPSHNQKALQLDMIFLKTSVCMSLDG